MDRKARQFRKDREALLSNLEREILRGQEAREFLESPAWQGWGHRWLERALNSLASLRAKIPSHDLTLYYAGNEAINLVESFLKAIPGQAEDDISTGDLASERLQVEADLGPLPELEPED